MNRARSLARPEPADRSTGGQPTFVKNWARGRADLYPVEAAGLRWLAAAGPDAAQICPVVDVDAERIVLQRLTPGRPSPTAAAEFGARLAVTHAAGAEAFGQPPAGWTGDGYIGQQRLSLRPETSWGIFYADQRLLPYAQQAASTGQLGTGGFGAVEQVCRRLRAGDFDDGAPPRRIHGDLWSGNVIWTPDGVVLIDPAAHGGHGLTDLAMLHLFGAPELRTITAAYAERAGLSPGWEDLIGLHQLHPLLVHAVSHGPSYGVEAARIAARYS